MRLGDRNTKYFHAISRTRKSRNRINSIFDEQGFEHFRDDIIGNVAESYFGNLFTTSQHSDLSEIIDGITCKVTNDMNRELVL